MDPEENSGNSHRLHNAHTHYTRTSVWLHPTYHYTLLQAQSHITHYVFTTQVHAIISCTTYPCVRQAPNGPLHFAHCDSILKPYVWETQKYNLLTCYTEAACIFRGVFNSCLRSALAKIPNAHGWNQHLNPVFICAQFSKVTCWLARYVNYNISSLCYVKKTWFDQYYVSECICEQFFGDRAARKDNKRHVDEGSQSSRS